MALTTTVRFRSRLFRPRRPEEEQVNPGVYGEELARWLADRLRETGGLEPRVDFEDFAWLVELPVGEATAWLFCANEFGSDDVWMIDVREASRLFGWFRRSKLRADARFVLCMELHAILTSEPEISELEWFATGKGGQEAEHAAEPHR